MENFEDINTTKNVHKMANKGKTIIYSRMANVSKNPDELNLVMDLTLDGTYEELMISITRLAASVCKSIAEDLPLPDKLSKMVVIAKFVDDFKKAITEEGYSAKNTNTDQVYDKQSSEHTVEDCATCEAKNVCLSVKTRNKTIQ